MDFARRKIGEFYITGLIGQGGMSQVYLAINPRTREKRAVKILAKRATASTVSYARFLREIEILRTLSHAHIVRILDSGVLEDCYFYMMELMSGSLAKRLAQGRMPLQDSVSMFVIICEAVAHAHTKGIIHRDLKPSNILLTDDGAPMVSDFGIAKALDAMQPSLTGSNDVLGTIAYLAPEQRVQSKNVDRRTDVYALGAIIYEMLMGFPPLGKFPWPRETRPGFPTPLQDVLEKCLAIHPEDRFLHAGELLSAVELFLGVGHALRQGISAQPSSIDRPRENGNMSDAPKPDRLERWFRVLRAGTTRERLSVVREMVEQMEPGEANGLLKIFPGENDNVRWGLIKVLGELGVPAATPMIIAELKNSYHRECAIEALGKIGAPEAFQPLRDFLAQHPESAVIALLPLARTGRLKSLRYLHPYLSHEMATVRQAAVRALGAVEAQESLRLLEECLPREHDERVRTAYRQSIRRLESSLQSKEATRDGSMSAAAEDKTLQLH